MTISETSKPDHTWHNDNDWAEGISDYEHVISPALLPL